MVVKIKVGDVFSTKKSGDVTVIEYISCAKVLVMFSDGNKINVRADKLREGFVKNPYSLLKINDTFTTNEGYLLTVLKYINSSRVLVKFEDGFEIVVTAFDLRNGNIKNHNHKSAYGVGYLGYGEFKKSKNSKQYECWGSMLSRCYDEKTQRLQPTYIGCSVDKKWLNFQEFAKWYLENYIDGFQIDKDLLTKGNKIYSPENCCFLPCEINNSLILKISKKSTLPIGVNKNGKNYSGQCNTEIKRLTKTFRTIEECSYWYKQQKESHIRNLAEKYKHILPIKTYNALLLWKV